MDPNPRVWSSREFILSLIAVVLGAVMGSGLVPDTHWVAQVMGMAAAALATIGYTANRAKVKAAEANAAATIATGGAMRRDSLGSP